MRLVALLLAALLCACVEDAEAFLLSGGSGGAGPPGMMLPLGVNLELPQYYATEFPFLNVMKSGGVSPTLGYNVGWLTQSSSVFDTEEEAYLSSVLDADGYPTTLTVGGMPGGQVFNHVSTFINFNSSGGVTPGAASCYQAGTYRLKFKGLGTVQVSNDGSLTLSNSTPNSYTSGTFTVTPSCTSGHGLQLSITAVNSSTDYPRDISLVYQPYAAIYDAGAIFNPAFTAMLAPFTSLRFMQWKFTNYEFGGGTATTSVSAGATSLTLNSPWVAPTGAYPVMFIDGEKRSVTLTTGATTATWSGGLANSISSSCMGGSWQWGSQCFYTTFFVENHPWANRSKPSNAFWDNADGVPLEIAVTLCNQINAGCYLNVPIMYSDADIQAMGQLVMSGTGMQTGFSGLNSALTGTFELSNEVWNCFTFTQCDAAGSLGGAQWPSQPSGGGNISWQRNWLGMRTAQMASDLQTAVGSTIFTRVIPTLGGQMSATGSVSDALATAYWSSGPACITGTNPCAYPIKAINIAPYWGGNVKGAECTTMTGVTTPLDDFFAVMTGQTGTLANGTQDYSASVPAGGWFGQANVWTQQYTALMPSYPALKLISYEGGDSFANCYNNGGLCGFPGNPSNTCAGWPALVTAAERDPRMGAAYLTQQTWWKNNVGATAANVFHIFQDAGPIDINGSYGLLESVMQPISPLSAAPPRYNGAVTYIQ